MADGKILFLHFCSPCHGADGQGDGLVVAHGFPAPPSYSKGQSSRGGAMKDLSDGKIYHTITYGLNAMGSYASQLDPKERLKVVLYVHHLQTL
jgi:mono/diheme cytochrome c family protein